MKTPGEQRVNSFFLTFQGRQGGKKRNTCNTCLFVGTLIKYENITKTLASNNMLDNLIHYY